ncbi:PREDICTED: thioredoxin-related transmembrane protein 4-like [Gekko japonicus]|uniref:Thioredoxin-related transmembrane protein 4-like n=1 Tax=Gekko japonicus TaxID=146911 RepID=A0ABM1JTZ9_GEKJA|nr:PREDICTED: thioredoxin-related transmembrane protein 4-like [Gekko japonicus]
MDNHNLRAAFTSLCFESMPTAVLAGRCSRTPKEQRFCICDSSVIEDLPHYILECSILAAGNSDLRRGAAAWLLLFCGAAAASVLLGTVSAVLEPEEVAGESRVRALSGSNWSLLLQGQWMVTFYAPWCPACQQMESTWEAFARDGRDLEISVGKVDVTQEPGVSGRFFVTTLPTIFHAKDGTFFRYRGSRTLEDLKDYILERKWEAVEPVPGWKSPSSIMMHGMAGLFYLSGWIRQIHSYLTGTLGIHEWGSYAVFILATLLIGLILGLILVLLGDCVFPSKAKAEESESVDQSYDQLEEQQETPEDTEGEPVTEKSLSDEDNEEEGEDESQENSSGDSAVESSMVEEDLEHHTSDQSSLRQRKNQEVADEL